MAGRILVGVDPVREDPAPLALASALGALTGARVVAIAVHPVHELPTGLVPPGYDVLMRDRAEAALKRALTQLPDGAEPRALAGRSVAGTLHRAVCQLGAGLLVVGSAHRGRVGRIVAGSVADGVLDGVACPVAVVPHGYEPPGAITRVGVGLAETIDGRAAIAAAAAIASRTGAVLEVLRAMQPVDWTGVAPPGSAYREALALARDAAAQAAREVADELAPGVDAIVHAVVESPLAALIEASAGLDLLVCGSRGYGPLRRVLLGSVSRPLSHQVRCPLVVVPRGAEADVERVFFGDGRVAEA